jgi:hypothetical protein
MIVSSLFLKIIVMIGLLITIAAPVLLIVMWIKDWKKGQLW